MRISMWMLVWIFYKLYMVQCFTIMFPDIDVFKEINATHNRNIFALVQRNFPTVIKKEADYRIAYKLLNGIDIVMGRYNHYMASMCNEKILPYFVLDDSQIAPKAPIFDSTSENQHFGKLIESVVEKDEYKVIRFISDSSATALRMLNYFKNLTRGQCNLSPMPSSIEINNCVNVQFKRVPQKTLYVLASDSSNFFFVGSVLKEMVKCTLQYNADILTFGTINMAIGTPDYGLSGATIFNAWAVNKVEKDNALKTLKILEKGLKDYKVVNQTKLFKNGTEIPFNRTLILLLIQGFSGNSSIYNGLSYFYQKQTKTLAGSFTIDKLFVFNKVWIRADLLQLGLRVGYYENLLQFSIKFEDTGVKLSGFFIDLIQLILPNTKLDDTYMNLSIVGRKLSNGSYTGALGELSSKRIEMILFPIELIPVYKLDFGVSESIYEGRFSMLITKARKKLDFFKFVKPYSILVWIILLVVVLAISIIIFLINAISMSVSNDNSKSLSLGDSIFYTVGSFLIAKMLVKPNMFATQIFYILIWLGTLLLIASYVANLTVILIFESVNLHTFTTLTDLNADKGDYRFVFVENSHLLNIILDEIDDPKPQKSVYLQLYQYAKLNWPDIAVIKPSINIEEFLMNNSDTGILNDEYHNLNYSLRNCNLTTLVDPSVTFSYVYLFQKNLNVEEVIRNNLINARESGAINGLLTKYLNFGKCSRDIPRISEVKPFDLDDFSGVFILIAIGLVLAFPIALIEYLWKKAKLNHQRKNMGTPLQFGKVYPVKVTGLDKHGIYVYLKIGVACFAVEDIVYIRKENLIGKKGNQGEVPSPIEQGITVGANLKVKYLGTLPNKATRSFMQVNK